MTRRLLSILGMSALLVVGMGACGSSTPQQPSGAATSAPAGPLPVTVPSTPGAKTATSWTMPSLVGSDLQNAQDRIQSLTDFAITITTSHDATGAGRHQIFDRNWRVCSQNIPPGRTIHRDTQIDFGAVKLEERCP